MGSSTAVVGGCSSLRRLAIKTQSILVVDVTQIRIGLVVTKGAEQNQLVLLWCHANSTEFLCPHAHFHDLCHTLHPDNPIMSSCFDFLLINPTCTWLIPLVSGFNGLSTICLAF